MSDVDIKQETIFDITVKADDGSSFSFNVRAADSAAAQEKLAGYLEELAVKLRS